MLSILDYKAGNQTSVRRALESLMIPCRITNDPDELLASEGVIFPGVGAAGQAMRVLKNASLDRVLGQIVSNQIPLLGICLGCQILLQHSEENDTELLGLLEGQCLRFPNDLTQEDGSRAPVPHMGWNTLSYVNESVLFADIPKDASFYFVHSYYTKPPREYVIAETTYGISFCSAYGRDGLWGVQFHPEKSGRPGLQILRNFYNYSREKRHAQ